MRQTPRSFFVIFTAAANMLDGGSLRLGFDIFKALENGEVVWVGCAESLKDAKSRVALLVSSSPSRYVVRDAANGQIVADMSPNDPDRSP
jgi:hypothetical protein